MMIKKTKRGFTLVELLATLAVLSIVLSIVVFSTSGVINNAREKSYETTINNVLVAGGNYTVENPELSEWEECDSGNCEYQCISVNELISNGYFKGDILESEVEKNVNIKEVDSVYIERDKDSKTITNKIFENEKTAAADRKCTKSVYGAIEFRITPSTWTSEKSVTITYTLNSSQDIATKASYEFTGENGQKIQDNNITFNSTRVNTVTVNGIKENGTLIAKIGNGETKTLYISTIDRGTPTITKYESKHNLANNQTVSITLSDTASGIKGYYFGKENPYTSTVTYESVANLKEVNLTKEVDSNGKWYLRTVDAAGNYNDFNSELSVLEFYETKLLSDSHGTVKPARIIDVKDSVYTLPIVNVENYYTFNGWYNNSDKTGSKTTSYAIKGDSTLYGKVTENLFGGSVSISGTTESGKKLTVDTSTVTLTNHSNDSDVSYTYQWYTNTTNSNSGGTKITGATKKTYTLTDNEVGKYVYVVVTASRSNYVSKTYTSNVSSKITSAPPVMKANPITVTANTLTYTGSSQQLVTVSNAKGSVWYSTKQAVTNSNKEGVGSTTIPSGTDAKTYTVYWYTSGNTEYEAASGSVSVTISKASNPTTVTAKSLTYTGSSQQLVTVSNAKGSVWYSTKQAVTNSNKEGVGSTTIPSGTDAKTYTVYWYSHGNDNYNSGSGSVSVTISKANNPIVVSANTLTYNGSSHQLVTVSNAKGTVWYSTSQEITSSNKEGVGSRNIPTGITAKTYKVYWYVNGNTNYKDKKGSVSVTINAAAPANSLSGKWKWKDGELTEPGCSNGKIWINWGYDNSCGCCSSTISDVLDVGVNSGNNAKIKDYKLNFTDANGVAYQSLSVWKNTRLEQYHVFYDTSYKPGIEYKDQVKTYPYLWYISRDGATEIIRWDYTMYSSTYTTWVGSKSQYQTIDFGSTPQTVTEEFYKWFTANATQVK